MTIKILQAGYSNEINIWLFFLIEPIELKGRPILDKMLYRPVV